MLPAAGTALNGRFPNSPRALVTDDARTDPISWVEYKAHITRSCHDDRPRAIVHVPMSPAPAADQQMAASVHATLSDEDRLPVRHLVNACYTDAGC
jgi:transposase